MPSGGEELTRRVLAALAEVQDPELRRPLTELGMIEGVEAPDAGGAGPVLVRLRLTIAACPAARRIEADVRRSAEAALREAGLALPVEVETGVMSPGQRRELTERLRGGRGAAGRGAPKRVLAVASGKGGVGKSSVTANLAVALAQLGLRTAILDADVHGYSIPGLMGLGGAVPTRLDETILPPVAHGVPCISIGMFLGSDEELVAWRGPMLHRTLEQFLRDVHFGDPDVLLVDLPPGTGDIALSLAQLLPEAEVLVTTTPQPAAAEVAVRAGLLAERTGQRVAGVVETMAGFTAPDGSRLELFGSGGGADVADRLTRARGAPVPLLASIPLSLAWRRAGDAGVPVVLRDPADPSARAVVAAARGLLPASGAARPLNLTPPRPADGSGAPGSARPSS
ncbi:MAG: P-loop NTPase [Pseudoclavibacter sp.]|nr:P-loop NTPase [Pseudoclavibacter sp.]